MVGFIVDAQRRRNDSSRAHNPTDLTHTNLQLLQLLRLKARAHDAQAIADTGTNLTVACTAPETVPLGEASPLCTTVMLPKLGDGPSGTKF
jgi:hypothetical protein